MSKLMMFTVYDKVSQVYQPPVYCHNQVHAMRHFTEVLHANEFLLRHAGDYSVFQVAIFDDEAGVVTGTAVSGTIDKELVFEMSELEVKVNAESQESSRVAT